MNFTFPTEITVTLSILCVLLLYYTIKLDSKYVHKLQTNPRNAVC